MAFLLACYVQKWEDITTENTQKKNNIVRNETIGANTSFRHLGSRCEGASGAPSLA